MDHQRSDISQSDVAFPCLNCGYDLRPAVVPGAGEIICPECGSASPARLLRHYGWRRKSLVQALVLLIVPPAVLIVTAWLFRLWSGESLHAVLCLIFAPVVIVAHGYVLWQFIDLTVTLKRSSMKRIQVGGLVCCVLVDLTACVAVARWFL